MKIRIFDCLHVFNEYFYQFMQSSCQNYLRDRRTKCEKKQPSSFRFLRFFMVFAPFDFEHFSHWAQGKLSVVDTNRDMYLKPFTFRIWAGMTMTTWHVKDKYIYLVFLRSLWTSMNENKKKRNTRLTNWYVNEYFIWVHV